LIGVLVTLSAVVTILVTIWILAKEENLFAFVPPNTMAFVVSGNESPDTNEISGGGLVDVIHEVPGKILDKSDPDKSKWQFKDGKEDRGLLHSILGVHWIGFGRSLRMNHVHDVYMERGLNKVTLRTRLTKFVYFSREQIIEEKGAKTIGAFRLNILFNILYSMIYPVKSVFGMADPNAVLTSMIRERVNGITGTQEPEYFLHGNIDNKRSIVDSVDEIKSYILEHVGIQINTVNLISIDLDEDSRKLFELIETTRRQNIAAISIAERTKQERVIIAEGEKAAGMLANDVAEDHVKRVLQPLGEVKDGALIRLAEAVEKTGAETIVLGASVLPVVGKGK
jgi:regulator of protease activity HflC (stomatin/prohibitin superfamily)